MPGKGNAAKFSLQSTVAVTRAVQQTEELTAVDIKVFGINFNWPQDDPEGDPRIQVLIGYVTNDGQVLKTERKSVAAPMSGGLEAAVDAMVTKLLKELSNQGNLPAGTAP